VSLEPVYSEVSVDISNPGLSPIEVFCMLCKTCCPKGDTRKRCIPCKICGSSLTAETNKELSIEGSPLCPLCHACCGQSDETEGVSTACKTCLIMCKSGDSHMDTSSTLISTPSDEVIVTSTQSKVSPIEVFCMLCKTCCPKGDKRKRCIACKICASSLTAETNKELSVEGSPLCPLCHACCGQSDDLEGVSTACKTCLKMCKSAESDIDTSGTHVYASSHLGLDSSGGNTLHAA